MVQQVLFSLLSSIWTAKFEYVFGLSTANVDLPNRAYYNILIYFEAFFLQAFDPHSQRVGVYHYKGETPRGHPSAHSRKRSSHIC